MARKVPLVRINNTLVNLNCVRHAWVGTNNKGEWCLILRTGAEVSGITAAGKISIAATPNTQADALLLLDKLEKAADIEVIDGF